ncbi:TniQ family protein [Bacillus anthracis]|uniref:TniQ family protein n=1 Tax=Bacillus cereus group TaxID=86661 RepID=UPI003D190A91
MGIQSINQGIQKEYKVEVSTLYSIEPIGLGTPYVESLTSYISRLAYIHNVRVGVLIKKVIAKELKNELLKNKIYNDGASSVTKGINGFGDICLDYVQALEKLTLRNDIIYLTMLSWTSIINVRKIVDNHRKWCSDCLGEWKEQGRPIYEPLIWYLRGSNHCNLHKKKLAETCWNCSKQLMHMHGEVRMGYCQYCQGWLGKTKNYKFKETQYHIASKEKEMVNNYGLLLEMAPKIYEVPLKYKSINILKEIKEEFNFYGKELAECFSVGLSTVFGWLNGRKYPSIDSLFEFSYNSNIKAYDLLTNEIIQYEEELNNLKLRNQAKEDTEKKDIKGKQLKKLSLKDVLEKVLESDEPESLEQIYRKYGYAPATMKKHYPHLYKEIKLKSKMHKDNIIKKRNNERREALERVLSDNLYEDLSLYLILQKLGISRSAGRSNFSEVCNKISERYKNYQLKMQEEHKAKIINEIEYYTYYLHEQGIYPSGNKIAERLSGSGYLLKPFFREAYLDLLKELGYRY